MTATLPTHPKQTHRLHAADAASAAVLPCLLDEASSLILDPWIAGLDTEDRARLQTISTAIAVASQQLALLCIRQLPEPSDAQLGALTVRLWALGTLGTVTQLGAVLPADTGNQATIRRARTRLERQYLARPGAARADGIDVLAGSLLA